MATIHQKAHQFLCLVCFISALYACKSANNTPAPQAPQSVFAAGQSQGLMASVDAKEISGVAHSRTNASILWTHNDSGDQARCFLVGTDGKDWGVVRLEGKTNRDWEDIAIATLPGGTQPYVFVGDIGDNNATHAQIFVHRFLEPNLSTLSTPTNQVIAAANIQTYTLQYPDGSRDAETLMIDPLTGDWFIVSKREAQVKVYRAAYPQSTTTTITLEAVATLPFTLITGGDISPDGTEILIKSYTEVMYWKRPNASTTIAQTLNQTVLKQPYTAEIQGEAIGFQTDAKAYYTLSEGTAVPVYRYLRNQ